MKTVLLPSQCYSSMGPTNVNTFVTGGFGGTSCATPNVAGIAGVPWSDNLNLDVGGVTWLLRHQARLSGDWGALGLDTTYGEGGLHLVNYHANTLFVDRSYGTKNLKLVERTGRSTITP